MNVDAAQWVGRRYALAGRPLSGCPFDANGSPEQRVFAARFVQGYLDAEPTAMRSVVLNEDDLLRSDLDEEEESDEELDEDLDDEELDEDEELDNHVAEAEEYEAELDDEDEAERSDYLDDDELLRAMDRNQLKHYWTKGKGLAKWLPKRKQWTALYRHLRKYVGSERAKRMAAQWVHEVTGNWPGSDAHRVATGHKPRGKRIGPG